jgi:hypothetical protein
MSQLTVYLCGPITGITNLNREVFEEAERTLTAKGYHVINPHKIPEHVGAKDQSWQGYMKRCIPYLMKTDLVALLPDWSKSKGACREVDMCVDFNIHTHNYDTIKVASLKQMRTIMEAVAVVWEEENSKVPGFSNPQIA